MSSERLLATPPNVALCRLTEIDVGAARNFVVRMRDGCFHGFVIRCDATVHGYVDRCPHTGAPLAQQLDDYLTPDRSLIACGWHGALFRIEDGVCVGGPCVGQKLVEWPVLVEDGWIKTGAVPAQQDQTRNAYDCVRCGHRVGGGCSVRAPEQGALPCCIVKGSEGANPDGQKIDRLPWLGSSAITQSKRPMLECSLPSPSRQKRLLIE